ncbi:hypothetical protein Mapa_000541 [Marchantia paleacea]|nr:hypothetical protein Mapa_000541 [Marchantia paleacea]
MLRRPSRARGLFFLLPLFPRAFLDYFTGMANEVGQAALAEHFSPPNALHFNHETNLKAKKAGVESRRPSWRNSAITPLSLSLSLFFSVPEELSTSDHFLPTTFPTPLIPGPSSDPWSV